MISFYPGPSRVHDEVPRYVKEAHQQGILSMNHRSDTFVKMSEKTIGLLKRKLNIPKAYTVFFTSSATECWEIIAQSLIQTKSYHLYNGSFGQKWFDYTHRLHPNAEPLPFGVDEELDARELIFGLTDGLLCLTQNETSNGTQVSHSTLRTIQKSNPSYLIAIDATSSMAGIALDFKLADIWFASVQKCFGLPAGLGLLVCSPRALELAGTVGEKNHYNSLPFMMQMMDKWQTPFTPNVLNIYLLMRVLENSDPIKEVHQQTFERFKAWEDFLSKRKSIRHLVTHKAARSFTVLPVTGSPEAIQQIKKKAAKEGLLLGEGYGELKSTTFRIANFPALKQREINKLMSFLKAF
jgi:phosphoserine aminotransferase